MNRPRAKFSPVKECEGDPIIEVGKCYLVQRNDDEWKKAEVIHKRFNKEKKIVQYYIHYESQDRRLDEWITGERFIVSISDSEDEADTVEDRRNSESSNDSRDKFGEKDKTEPPETCVIKTEPPEEDEKEQTSENPDDVELEHEELTRIKYIQTIQFGMYEINAWYFSPYPDEYGKLESLYICEFCLKYMKHETTFRIHLGQCEKRSPPGALIYQKGTLYIYEIDAARHRLYCQNLCLLAKLFIDHKTVFFDVDPFVFYVLCEKDEHGYHLKGYFSKEKDSHDGYNVACILILPPFQRLGYGKLLIGFSYELSKIEGVIGTPEPPVSDLGKLSYKSYWSWVILNILKDFNGTITIATLSKLTSFTETDILSTLGDMGLLKYWSDNDTICVTPNAITDLILSNRYKRPRLTIDSCNVLWSPHSWLFRDVSDEQ